MAYIDIVRSKLNWISYDGDVNVPDDIIQQHVNSAISIFSPFLPINYNTQLYDECVTEFAKYTVMVSWAANAIDIEQSSYTWKTILDNERKILRSFLYALFNDEYIINNLLGDDSSELTKDNIKLSVLKNSYNAAVLYNK